MRGGLEFLFATLLAISEKFPAACPRHQHGCRACGRRSRTGNFDIRGRVPHNSVVVRKPVGYLIAQTMTRPGADRMNPVCDPGHSTLLGSGKERDETADMVFLEQGTDST